MKKSGCLWIDITELLDQFRFARYPTGVGRVIINLADALRMDRGDVFENVRLLFWGPVVRRALTTDDPRLLPLSDFLPRLSKSYEAAGLRPAAQKSRAMKAFVTSLPRRWRYRAFPSDNGTTLFRRWARGQNIEISPVRFAPGDCLFAPGSFWLGKYAPQLAAQARAAGAPVAAFVHDVLLLSHPQWLPHRHSRQFRRGCETFLPLCTSIICNSANTRDELRRLVSLPADMPISTCRLGDRPFGCLSEPVPAAIREKLGRRYVLYVSTITPRKNHALLVEAWRLLEKDLGAVTPDLYFVGGGVPDARLATLLEKAQAEGGRISRLTGVDDSSLEVLYEHAWMTAYPSLAEGYGLPIAEALSHGKICLATPSGGIREVADDLIDFIDPLDPESVAAKVKLYLTDTARYASREAEIKGNYHPTDWTETARTVRTFLENTVAAQNSIGAPTSGGANPSPRP